MPWFGKTHMPNICHIHGTLEFRKAIVDPVVTRTGVVLIAINNPMVRSVVVKRLVLEPK
jgi:hypothetical protein